MIYTQTTDFQKAFLKEMTFSDYKHKNYTLYKNENRPKLGYFIKYSRKGYYDLIIGEYTVPKDFSLDFDHNETLTRFGSMYHGITEFEIENNSVSSFTPSSFFILENEMKGKQFWKKGQHFHGAEIIIYKKYFDEFINPNFSDYINFESLIKNYTYNYLPTAIISIIQTLNNLAQKNKLTSLFLESKILESISLISNEILSSSNNIFSNQVVFGKIKIGKDRFISLSSSDIDSLQKAYEILTENALNPPTIAALSKMVFLNEQKLKAGFSFKYHMSINKYTTTIKMSFAENLLVTTDLSIDLVANKVGYSHTSNFIKMFKKTYNLTPLAFRQLKHS